MTCCDHGENMDVSIIMPAYNEEKSIGEQLRKVQAVMDESGVDYHLIVVDDGSTDHTADEASRYNVQLIRLPQNCGYGAALKAGISVARTEYVVIIDADGTYPPDAIPKLLEKAREYDMVVGARSGARKHEPFMRKPCKWFLRKLASYLAGQSIPDLNSGLRVMRKSIVEIFSHILPAGFSFTTTITLAHLCNDYLVYYHPIEYYRRTGQSKIRPGDAFYFLMLIIRTMVYFNPLKIFLPLGAVFFLAGVGKFIYDLFLKNLSESAVLGIIAAFIIWTLGLLSDQIAKTGMGQKWK